MKMCQNPVCQEHWRWLVILAKRSEIVINSSELLSLKADDALFSWVDLKTGNVHLQTKQHHVNAEFTCAGCGRLIEGTVDSDGKLPYHPECKPDELTDLRRRVEALEKGCKELVLKVNYLENTSSMAMKNAMRIIETIGTTAEEDTETLRRAEAWLKTYFPERV